MKYKLPFLGFPRITIIKTGLCLTVEDNFLVQLFLKTYGYNILHTSFSGKYIIITFDNCDPLEKLTNFIQNWNNFTYETHDDHSDN